MAEVFDMLIPSKAEAARFTVDTSGPDYVSLAFPVGNPIMYNANGDSMFPVGDNFMILSTGIVLPEALCIWKDPAVIPETAPYITVVPTGNVSGDGYYIDMLGHAAKCYIPMTDHEWIVGMFSDTTQQYSKVHPGVTLNSEAFRLKVEISAFKISMKNVPASLHGETLLVYPWLKILHNYTLT